MTPPSDAGRAITFKPSDVNRRNILLLKERGFRISFLINQALAEYLPRMGDKPNSRPAMKGGMR